MNKRIVFLQNNMLDDEERELFQSHIPYAVEDDAIKNENGFKVALTEIWVDFCLGHHSLIN
ncbi:hypothetical protein [Bacillus atrophaeus]|uniref:hypothetical protein n=1 Tax=Bacillus atrophaeus TaxID=1452 RepID=UPI002E232358|nr:hypothetical protein [Bacillus atrophaeus]